MRPSRGTLSSSRHTEHQRPEDALRESEEDFVLYSRIC